MRYITPSSRSSQQGATMIVALIFLIILGLLGVTVANTNTLQERMSGNTRNRDLAFQAAEHALKDAESNLAAYRAQPFNGTVNGLLPNGESHSNDSAYWKNTFAWNTASNYRTPTANLTASLVDGQPRYVVEKMPDVPKTPGPGNIEYYRVTARGLGKDGAVVVLQAMYKFE